MQWVNRTITIHNEVAKREGLEHWEMYTDHNPIELTMRVGRDWAREEERKKKKETKKADIAKVRGDTKEAREWRGKLEEEVTRRMQLAKQTSTEELSWRDLAEILRESATQVLGEEPKKEEEPWRRGKTEIWKQIGETIAFMRARCSNLRKRQRLLGRVTS